eukprot:TRINITY_DN3480_c0_g1_i1.p1 TRINITY_DN3480_c0_g1~~TRINITY_DN3480_c0_g1_i1.p1  ORF type:complete len:243 (-),score=47.28 TRINITY_DN3480_c0_g1_i1:5-733(-)
MSKEEITTPTSSSQITRPRPAKEHPSMVQAPGLWEYSLQYGARFSVHQENLNTTVKSHPAATMSSSRDEINFLKWLASLVGAKKIVEVGVFLGATTLALAEGLPEGAKIYALDLSDEFTAIGAKHWVEAGVRDKIELIIKSASESLKELVSNPSHVGTFDLAFIDANKDDYDQYYELCLQLVRKGGIVAIDNVFWHGDVLDAQNNTKETVAIRELNKKVHKDERVAITMVPFADGLTLCRKL